MTLPVVDEFGAMAVDGPRYKVGATCASPLCNKWADHAHHLVRGIGRPDWVQLPDGTITGNLVPLCARCHKLVTGMVGGHTHAIRWQDDSYWWANVLSREAQVEYMLIEELTEQPPRQGEEDPQDINACPHCGRKKKRTMQHAPARKRKTWTVKVPDDEAEDGAQVMDDFVDALAYEFGFDVDGGALTRYHTLARACAFAIQHKHELPDEAKEGLMDRIAQHDQFLAMAKASLKPERTFIVFTFPSEEEAEDLKQPEIYVSAHSSGVEWAIDRLLDSLVMGEIEARVERWREFLDRNEPDPE